MTQTRRQVTSELASRLGSAAEARWLVEEVLGGRGARGDVVRDDDQDVLDGLLARRLSGEPLQYVLGSWAFRSLELLVDRRALIPRPETEQVVGYALDEVRRALAGAPSARRSPLVVDLGTGSGAIALSLALELDEEAPGLEVWATDVSPEALELAGANRDRLGRTHPRAASRVRFARGAWYEALEPSAHASFSLVVSNPPYVSREEWESLPREIHHEPFAAVISEDGRHGTPGFASVEAVVEGAVAWLEPEGGLVVEITPTLAEAAVALAESFGYVDVRIEHDLSGRERVLVARRPPLP